ncbi:MAG TPA: hypothetical protein QF646_02765 [Candidatus Poseidoniales archaeon]|nr:hypothetical protein [Candidatus Poseidoniales archaeon]
MRLPLCDDDLAESGLERAGWTRQFTTTEPRLTEMCDMFRSLGKQVKVIRTTDDKDHGNEICYECLEASENHAFTIWTRELDIEE